MRAEGARGAALQAFLEAHGAALAAELLDASGRPFLAADVDGRIAFASRAACDALSLEVGAPAAGALPELADAVARCLAEATEVAGPRVTRGARAWTTRITPLAGREGPAGFACAFAEVADADAMALQMRAYEELTREQEAIINSTAEGLWICDGQANVMRVNPASERLNFLRAEQVVGRNMRELVAEGMFDRSVTVEVLRTRAPVNMLQHRQGRKLVLNGTPVFDDAGQVIRVVVNERDITELDALQRHLEEQEAVGESLRNQILEEHLAQAASRQVIAKSQCIRKALQQAIKLTQVDTTVLITGESGVGKGLFADLIHRHSARKDRPLLKINCGAIPESLVEAELFGYERGAFTGAQAGGKPGYFELAEGGVVFLDEIGELPLSSQVKLLRFLEDGRVTRVGGTQSRQVDVRILAATHRDLRAMVEQGGFRLDLFYRLSVIPLHVPALRERVDCILPTLRHFVDHFAERLGVKRRLTRAATDVLLAYPWPGNVREAINLCERLVVMADHEAIDVDDLPREVVERAGRLGAVLAPESLTLARALEATERTLLLAAKERYKSQVRMAEALGVDQSTVARKLKRHGLL